MTNQPTHPEVGGPAPEFKLPATTGNEIALSDFRGRSDVVLYFYPKDDTPGCTKEACAFRDLGAEFKRAGAVVLGVSADSLESHRAFAEKYALTFPLLSDPDRSVIQRYGAWGERVRPDGQRVIGILRTTFLIDRNGVVRKVYPNVTVDGHAEAILADLETLRASS